jgi:phospholipase/carboxylesterase
MKTLSALSNDSAFALAFRTLQPPPDKPTSLLVLLHGVGGNESNLAALGAEVDSRTLVVLPRGPIALGPTAFGWFRVAFTGNGPQIVASEADASRRALVDFIEQLQQAHGIDAAHTVVAGFSQGGILSASVALTAPERVAGFAVLAGRILPELEPLMADAQRLSTLRG